MVLIDTGNTHNFLDCNVPKVMGIPIWQQLRLQVTVADGRRLTTNGIGKKVAWEV